MGTVVTITRMRDHTKDQDPATRELVPQERMDLDLQTLRRHQTKWNSDSLASKIDLDTEFHPRQTHDAAVTWFL